MLRPASCTPQHWNLSRTVAALHIGTFFVCMKRSHPQCHAAISARLQSDSGHTAATLNPFSASGCLSTMFVFCFQGLWRIAIYNPMRLYQIGYQLTAVKLGNCLNDCSNHGLCNSDGLCDCSDNWIGGDCSVNQAGGGQCQEGTHKSTSMSVTSYNILLLVQRSGGCSVSLLAVM